MIAESSAVFAPARPTPAGAARTSRGLLDTLAALFGRFGKTGASAPSTDSERYWTSIARGM